MKIFISWSGPTSHQLASVVHDWLKLINQHFQPFLSSEDIPMGSRWLHGISKELENTHFGILCLTKDNLEAPWICFEAGALSKQVESSQVAPILFGVQPSDVQGPLKQFQASRFEADDFAKLARSVNSASKQPRDDRSLEMIIPIAWQDLRSRVVEILATAESAQANGKLDKPPGAIEKSESTLEEILVLVRQQSQALSDPEKMFPSAKLEQLFEKLQNRLGLMAGSDFVWNDIEWGLREISGLSERWKLAPDQKTAMATSALVSSLEHTLEQLMRLSGRSSKDRHRRFRARVPTSTRLPTAPSATLADLEILRQRQSQSFANSNMVKDVGASGDAHQPHGSAVKLGEVSTQQARASGDKS